MHGDQGFYEKGFIINLKIKSLNIFTLGHNASFSRSSEKDLTDKLDGIVSLPQEWHKKKVWTLRINLLLHFTS